MSNNIALNGKKEALYRTVKPLVFYQASYRNVPISELFAKVNRYAPKEIKENEKAFTEIVKDLWRDLHGFELASTRIAYSDYNIILGQYFPIQNKGL